jgi:hypothetical protein
VAEVASPVGKKIKPTGPTGVFVYLFLCLCLFALVASPVGKKIKPTGPTGVFIDLYLCLSQFAVVASLVGKNKTDQSDWHVYWFVICLCVLPWSCHRSGKK